MSSPSTYFSLPEKEPSRPKKRPRQPDNTPPKAPPKTTSTTTTTPLRRHNCPPRRLDRRIRDVRSARTIPPPSPCTSPSPTLDHSIGCYIHPQPSSRAKLLTTALKERIEAQKERLDAQAKRISEQEREIEQLKMFIRTMAAMLEAQSESLKQQ